MRVKVLETDEKGRVKLSMKALLDRPAMPPREPRESREPQTQAPAVRTGSAAGVSDATLSF